MVRRVLLYFRGKWSSTDPVDRLVGALGKAVVELGAALVVGGGFVGLLFVADVLVGQLRLFDVFPVNVVAVAGPVAFVGNIFWCEILLDMRQVEGEESTRSGQPEADGQAERSETDEANEGAGGSDPGEANGESETERSRTS